MEKKIFGLDFGDLERLEVLGEVEFPAGAGGKCESPISQHSGNGDCRDNRALSARLRSLYLVPRSEKDGGYQTGTGTKQQSGENGGGMG